MTVVESQYFTLLRSALWATTPDIEGEIDWNAVMKIARHQANNVLVSDVALRMDSDHRPSGKMSAKMQDELRTNLMIQMRLRQILVSAVELLRTNAIEPVLLKGFGLASLYPNPSLRQFGDIDLFVGQDRFHEACALLSKLPGAYTWCEPSDVGRHFNVEFGKYVIETHRVSADVIDKREHAIYAAIEHDGTIAHPQRISLDGFQLSVPSNEFMVFFTFFHAWHHFTTSGVGLRQISDVAMTLHACHDQLDCDKLRQWLTDMHLMEPWQTFGYLMVDPLGLPQAEMPFYDASCRRKAQKLLRRIMAEGNFKRQRNFKRNRPKRRLWQKLHALICTFIDFFHLVALFPNQAFRELKTSINYGLNKNFGKKG